MAKADLVLFPECALTGFTSLVKHTDYSEVFKSLEVIQEVVDRGKATVIVPSVVKVKDAFFNSAFVMNPGQSSIQIFKEGLTDSEKGFFTAGVNKSRQFTVNGYRIGLLICFEATQDPWRYLLERELPEIILWPAYWGGEEEPTWNEKLTKDDLKVFQNNKIWKTQILRTTFYENHENIGQKHGPFGQSLVIDDNNDLRYFAAKSKPENCVVTFQKVDGKTRISSVERLTS